jgi:hypothetical protein
MALISPKHLDKDVAAAGTAVPLINVQTLAMTLVIQAKSTNSGLVYIGDSTVSAASYGASISAGNSVSIEMPLHGGHTLEVDLSEIYIDAGTNDDGVTVLYYQRS